MANQVISELECEVMTKGFQLIGQSITANFPQSFPDAALQVHTDFVSRRGEIANAVSKEVLFSPYMCNGIFATYFACLEVNEIIDVPEGMIGFQLPEMKYAKVNCTTKSIGEGYSTIFDWMKQNGYKQKYYESSCQLEIFYLEENAEEERVEILIPLQQ